MRIRFLMLALFVALFCISIIAPTSAGGSINVVWRQDEGQYYTYDQYSTLVEDLKDAGISTSYYSVSELFGGGTPPNVDYFGDPSKTVIIIPNPPNDFSSTELDFLKSFVESGGNLLIMGDIQYDDRHYGKPEFLNNLLDYIGVSDKVKFWGTNDNGDEIKDETNNFGYPWQVIVTSEYFNPHIISYGIEKVVINSPSLVVSDPTIIVATSPPTSYAESAQGLVHTYGNIPWLVALELGAGKIVVCGSSKMFSNTYLYGTSTPYIRAEDNEKLFFNIIWWLTGQRMEAPQPIGMIGAMSIFPIIAGIISGILIRKEGRIEHRTLGYAMMIVAIIYALAASIQVFLFGQVIVGTAIPDWGAITKIKGEKVPAELNAFIRYLFAGVVEMFVGVMIVIFVEWLDKYLDLGLMRRLGISSREEVMKE